MKMNIMGNPMPRPVENLKDLLKGGAESQSAPMASDVETAIGLPKKRKAPKRPLGTEKT
jgi:hypothetical protein